jgi:hypothetical protein
MRWRLIGGLFSLKTLLLACVLAPVPATAISTPALAQFRFVIPIPGIQFQGGRRYYGRSYQRPRYTRRHRGGESRSAAASPGSGQSSGSVSSSGSTGGKVRGTVD